MLDTTFHSRSLTAGVNSVGQYMEFDVGHTIVIFGVLTQGRGQSHTVCYIVSWNSTRLYIR